MKKVVKRVLIVLACLLGCIVLVVGAYVIYLLIQYDRIQDKQVLEVQNNQEPLLQQGETMRAFTYNIGFGAYDPPYSFFMDTGLMDDGTPTRGLSSRAASEEAAQTNTAGSIALAQAEEADFLLFQEVDKDADRSWHVNQYEEICAAFPGYGDVYASNYHTAYLFFPPLDPIGAIEAGVVTLSDSYIDEALRRSYPIDESFPAKFFDLDRCFSVCRLPVEGGQELVLINSHMSAYDKGGTVRNQQIEMLYNVMAEERGLGNWVVVGGDFNHALGGTIDLFPDQQQVPEWIVPFDEEDLPEGFAVVEAENITEVATCRGSDIPYTPGVNYLVVVDGFIVSDNVSATAENIDAGFQYSDHNPVVLSFVLE